MYCVLPLKHILIILLSGVSGDTCSLYSRVGDTVSLSCTNVVYPNCSSTTWTYHRTGLQSAFEEVGHGKIKTYSERADRLKVGSDCSLHVSDVRAEDAGKYTCQQYLSNGSPYGNDAPVHLSVLTSEPVILRCFLYTSEGPGICSRDVTEHVSLLWVDEAGNKLENDSRHQVTQTFDCDITLTVTLQKEDNNRKWTCQLNINEKKNISFDFTFMVPGNHCMICKDIVHLPCSGYISIT
uniref:Ig-like domain-containing protein n=1 Tax=Esox lucius TaxID=8010 RepID=A0A3P8Y3Q6_ESOLU